MKFETGQTSEPTSANISIVSRSSKRGPGEIQAQRSGVWHLIYRSSRCSHEKTNYAG